MEMILTSTGTEDARITSPLRAFMDDITTLSKSEVNTRSILKWLDEEGEWSGMKFTAKKSCSCTLVKGVQKEIKYQIAGVRIPMVKEKPVKSLRR